MSSDSSKARARLGWEPSYSFEDLLSEMARADLEALTRGGAAAK